MKWYLKAFRQYATFSGRAQRSEFWFFRLFFVIGLFVLMMIGAIFDYIFTGKGYFTGILGLIFMLIHIIPMLAVSIRRLHDINKSGWWYLIVIIPFGIFVFYIFALFDSDDDNIYGANPKVDKYVDKHSDTQYDDNEIDYLTDDSTEDEIYEKIMIEIEEDKKIKSTWAKAFSQAKGDDNKANALYISLRVQDIQSKQKLKQQKEDEEAKNPTIQLQLFLKKNRMNILKKISSFKIRVNYSNTPIDVNIEYKNGEWQIVD